jgi:hypothetical protein
LRDVVDAIRARGAELVVVGNGTPAHAADFRDTQHILFPLLVDPQLAAYEAAGLRRGILGTLGPGSVGRALRAFRSGFRQGRTQGDPWQLGGVLVIRPGGKLAYRQVSSEAGDHASPQELLAALDTAK